MTFTLVLSRLFELKSEMWIKFQYYCIPHYVIYNKRQNMLTNYTENAIYKQMQLIADFLKKR